MNNLKIKWSDFVVGDTVNIIFKGLKSAVFYRTFYVKVEAAFEGNKNFDLILPYKPFQWAIERLPTKQQIKIRDEVTHLRLTKLEKGYMKIELLTSK